MKEKFTDHERNLLKTVPVKFMYYVAAADGKVDSDEMAVIAANMTSSQVDNRLHAELLADTDLKTLETLIKKIQNVDRTILDAANIKKFLKSKLSDDEFIQFIKSAFSQAVDVAKASGGFVGLGNKVSNKEVETLKVLAETYGLDIESLTARS